ncbi:flagellar hook-length control protein FliK [Sulfurimonas sp.]
MVSFDIKKETSSSLSSLNTAPVEQKEGTLSFSDLLKGKKEVTDDKITQNSTLILALKKDEKISSDTFTDKNIIELESLELDSEITASMTKEDLKVLLKEAKQFLKNKIVQSDGFKKAEIDALPKTLNGLVQVAKKIGIDISKITLEEVKTEIPKINLDIEKPLHVNKEATSEPIINNDDVVFEMKAKKQTTQTVKTVETNEIERKLDRNKKETVKNEQQLKSDVKSTPLFKAQNSAAEITTQQIVATRADTLVTQKNTPKQKVDETLKMLLRTDKVANNDTTALTADFTVATAKVIAPRTTKEAETSFAALLKNENTDATDVQGKTDGLNVAKADSFEVKLNEAKQMVKYLSQDVKSAIEDYKSPFTRIKVQLNPQRLGEVDLTIVQRGKNLHINLSSNNTAINTLAMNANDLKVQLNNNGINNASLNFNSNPQGDDSQARQQEQHRQQQAKDEYNYFETQESNEEVLSSLEIVVPYYA